MEGILNAKKQREKDEAENRQKLLENKLVVILTWWRSIKYRELVLVVLRRLNTEKVPDTYTPALRIYQSLASIHKMSCCCYLSISKK